MGGTCQEIPAILVDLDEANFVNYNYNTTRIVSTNWFECLQVAYACQIQNLLRLHGVHRVQGCASCEFFDCIALLAGTLICMLPLRVYWDVHLTRDAYVPHAKHQAAAAALIDLFTCSRFTGNPPE